MQCSFAFFGLCDMLTWKSVKLSCELFMFLVQSHNALEKGERTIYHELRNIATSTESLNAHKCYFTIRTWQKCFTGAFFQVFFVFVCINHRRGFHFVHNIQNSYSLKSTLAILGTDISLIGVDVKVVKRGLSRSLDFTLTSIYVLCIKSR